MASDDHHSGRYFDSSPEAVEDGRRGDYGHYVHRHAVGDKRKISELDDASGAGPAVKRINVNIDLKEETFIKFLLPSFVAGIIIGSGGTTVAELMETTNTIIKFSPGRELYPKTNERVCVIIGSIPNICIALRRIFSKIANSPHRKPDDSQEYLRHFKMLVSNIAAGMTIGKSGQTVKAIQQECSVKIQISNKDDSSLPERTLNIVGESTEEIVAAVKMVLDQVKEDPDANKWKKLLTYGAYLASPAAVGGAHGHASSLSSVSLPTTGFQTSGYSSGMSELSAGAATNSSFLSMLQHPAYAAALSSAMQSNSAVAGLMGGASGHGSTVPTTSGSSFNQALLSYIYAQSLMSGSSYFGQYNPVFVDGVNMSVPGATIASFDVAVPEVMVSSVVGPGAKLLTDLMQSTGARLQLSQKGDYFAGTYNRKLTISGPILSVQAAHMVVLQKLMKDQEAYQKQGLV